MRQSNHSTNPLPWELKSVACSGSDLITRVFMGNRLADTIQADAWDRTKMKSVGTSDTSADRLSGGNTFDSENNRTARSWIDFANPSTTSKPVVRAENFTYDKLNLTGF